MTIITAEIEATFFFIFEFNVIIERLKCWYWFLWKLYSILLFTLDEKMMWSYRHQHTRNANKAWKRQTLNMTKTKASHHIQITNWKLVNQFKTWSEVTNFFFDRFLTVSNKSPGSVRIRHVSTVRLFCCAVFLTSLPALMYMVNCLIGTKSLQMKFNYHTVDFLSFFRFHTNQWAIYVEQWNNRAMTILKEEEEEKLYTHKEKKQTFSLISSISFRYITQMLSGCYKLMKWYTRTYGAVVYVLQMVRKNWRKMKYCALLCCFILWTYTPIQLTLG